VEKYKKNKESLILIESAKLFRHKGYSATSMDEIAAAVGLSKAGLFHYFASKEEILYKITKPAMIIGVDMLSEIAQSDITPKEKLRKALHDQLELIDQYFPRHFMLSGQDLNCVSSKMRKEMFPLMSRYGKLWRDIIAEGISAGQFRADLNMKLTVSTIIGMLAWVVEWYEKDDAVTVAQIAEHHIALLGEGMYVNSVPDISLSPLCEANASES